MFAKQRRKPSRSALPQGFTRRAFTLIELLVVIAIIALLAAILFPVFGRARENARKSSCSNNLKQIAVGVAQYVQDYDESFPWAWGSTGGNTCWWQLIYPYVKSTQVFQCPSDSNRNAGGNNFTSSPPAPGYVDGRFHISYGVNYPVFFNNGYGAGVIGYPFNMADMPKPAATVMFADTGVTAGTATSTPNAWLTTNVGSKTSAWLLVDPTCTSAANTTKPCNPQVTNSGDSNWAAPSIRHLDTTNIAFADGHVKSLRPEAWYYADSNWLNPKSGGP